MARFLLIAAQLTATFLFLFQFQRGQEQHWWAWGIPLLLIVLVIINSFWFTRFVSWVVFAVAFFAFLLLLSAFTLRWRLEPGFVATPFYINIGMYVAFVYASLGQLKLLGKGRR